tara:strand:- start:66 stop:374 length:309 start_codon:yes stop_codon:yes gene_type:complete
MTKLFLFSSILLSSLFITQNLNAAVFKVNEFEKDKNELLIVSSCGGGGHGAKTLEERKEKKKKQAKAKLNVKKRIMAKKEAAGKSTSKLEAEIKELEALLLE